MKEIPSTPPNQAHRSLKEKEFKTMLSSFSCRGRLREFANEWIGYHLKYLHVGHAAVLPIAFKLKITAYETILQV